MTKQRKQTVLTIALLALVALAVLVVMGGCVTVQCPDCPEPPLASTLVPIDPLAVRERLCFNCSSADNLVKNGYDIIMYSDDQSTQKLKLYGDTGDVDAAGEVQVGTFMNLTAVTFITVTNGAAFTPTGTFQAIKAAGEVTPTVETSGYTAGDELILWNNSAQTINLADSGTMKLSAAWAATQDDVLRLRFDGTNWLEESRSAN